LENFAFGDFPNGETMAGSYVVLLFLLNPTKTIYLKISNYKNKINVLPKLSKFNASDEITVGDKG